MSVDKNYSDTIENKTSKIITLKGIKKQTFVPSGLELWTVVGSEGEYVEFMARHICTCPQFFFRTIRGERQPCYHILAVEKAQKNNNYSTITCNDDEIHVLVRLLLE